MTLNQLHPGQTGVIRGVCGQDALRKRLLEMGLTPGTRVTVARAAPFGDPIEVWVRGYALSLRRKEAARIELI